ncbi:uncharacterized protein Z518_05316 [Rhinocladiella mackenziei CBS 650.93]|uniref:Uncharacterized protein n=1 Tax=Rhinocladiella mackenziei CBS 650.93 TaxID=1442369 RepID=A0A0D2H200_9EURO|nr:uncharacterized protein Z518_05316 [Rhinocladiella mackenziei CBS 650.93]KIX04448.1 hypothetical protein Z518_05316 [Rhinocladiella mackenziei CBS 650.93]
MKSWDHEQLLEWIQQTQPNIFRDDEDVVTFKAAEISGTTFLECAGNLDFFRRIHLPYGVYWGLAYLGKEVVELNNQPNQTAGRKRKGDETDPPEEPPTSPKRRQKQKETLTQLATEANRRRKAIKDMITQMNDFPDQRSNSVDPLPGAVDKLSDPTLNHTLDFPFVGCMPERFNEPGIDDDRWLYMGRTMFKNLLREGFGKSHFLAALVCYFAAQDERVVYLPDCQGLLDNPISYVTKAMLFAWADDLSTQEEIMDLRTQDQIDDFFRFEKNVIFVVDEMNAFKTNGIANTEKTARLREWVISFTSPHKTIFSSSANSTDDLEEFKRQTSNSVVRVYGGFNETAMKQWWKQHEDIEMGEYNRDMVEDATGCIPLLLNECVVGKTIDLTVPRFHQISDDAAGFVQRIRSTVKGFFDYVTACTRNEPVPRGWNEHIKLVGHRYFYRNNNGTGGYTCGLVRDAVTNQLLELDISFINTDFLASLRDFAYNRSLVGFMMAYAVLASIRSKWLKVCEGIDKGMQLRLFKKPSDIRFDIDDTPVLYRPRDTNYRTIDGMIVLIRTKRSHEDKAKLLIFPIQITVAKKHSKSHLRFLHEYRKWAEDKRSDFDIGLEFLWITPGKRDIIPHQADLPWPEYKEHYIPFEDVSMDIWTKYQGAQGGEEEKDG